MSDQSTIELDGSQKALNPCRFCGSCRAFIGDGKGPHAKSLRCDGCGKFLGWLSLDAAIGPGLYEQI